VPAGDRQRRAAARRDPAVAASRTLGGVFTRIIDRNTTIPTKKSQVFSTAEDNQNAVTHPRLPGRARDGGRQQGARPVRPDGHSARAARHAADRGHLRHRTPTGIVNVSAKDKATGKEQQIRIQASGGLSEADIEKMVKDAEANAAEDKKRREAVDAKNHADALVHSTEKALAEHGSKVADTSAAPSRTPSAI